MWSGFGLVPGAMIFHVITRFYPQLCISGLSYHHFLLHCDWLKFNIDERQDKLPSLIANPCQCHILGRLTHRLVRLVDINPYFLMGLTGHILLPAGSRNSDVFPQIQNLSWKDNRLQFIFLGGAVLLIAFLWKKAIALLFYGIYFFQCFGISMNAEKT